MNSHRRNQSRYHHTWTARNCWHGHVIYICKDHIPRAWNAIFQDEITTKISCMKIFTNPLNNAGINLVRSHVQRAGGKAAFDTVTVCYIHIINRVVNLRSYFSGTNRSNQHKQRKDIPSLGSRDAPGDANSMSASINLHDFQHRLNHSMSSHTSRVDSLARWCAHNRLLTSSL